MTDFTMRHRRALRVVGVMIMHGWKWPLRWGQVAVLPALALCLFGLFLNPAVGATNANAVGEREVARGHASGAAPYTHAWKRLAEEFVVADRTTGYHGGEAFVDFLRSARAGKNEAEKSWRAVVYERGWLLTCVLMILGGLALNLTPCILPMIPVNLAIIGAGAQAASRRRGLLLGGTYGMGMAVAYGALGGVIVVTGSRFGTLNASPWFNMGIAALFVALSLVVLGVIPVDFSKLQEKAKQGKEQKKGSALVAFGLGSVMALLAGACVAPVVISVILFAADLFAEGKTYGLLLPLLLGIGMGLPWPFAGAGLSFLPKPGGWMRYVKYALGVIVLGFAVYYGYQALTLFRNRSETARRKVEQVQRQALDKGWLDSLDQAFSQAKAQAKPLLIDFWASWCHSCTKMEGTFKDPDVQDELASFVKVKYQADEIRDPRVKEVLDSFDVVGLPTYLVLLPKTLSQSTPGGGAKASESRP